MKIIYNDKAKSDAGTVNRTVYPRTGSIKLGEAETDTKFWYYPKEGKIYWDTDRGSNVWSDGVLSQCLDRPNGKCSVYTAKVSQVLKD